MAKIITILEAQVAPEKAAALEQAYSDISRSAGRVDGEPLQSFLMRGTSDATLWRILTVWSSREALDKMRSMPGLPVGVQIFRAVGAEPALSVFQVPGELQ